MSAAEKLRALDSQWRQDVLGEGDVAGLLDALPQIIEVVEALEYAIPRLPPVKQIKFDPKNPHPKVIAKAALNALDEALT